MNNRKIFCTLIIVIIMVFKIDVEAATCTAEQKQALKQEARAIQIIPVLDDEFDPFHEYTYSVNITNFSNKFYIMDSYNEKIEYDKDYTPERLYGLYEPGKTVSFVVKGARGQNCAYESLATIRVTFEYYNDYSTYPECEGLEDFDWCKRNYSGKIESDEKFYEKVKEYKEKIEEKPIDNPEEKSLFDKFMDFVKNNKFVVITIIALIIIAIIGVVIVIKRKRKNKVKIDLE